MTDTTVERTALSDSLATMMAAACFLIGLTWAFGSPDPAMSFHGWVFAIAAAVAGYFVLSQVFGAERPVSSDDVYMDGPIRFATIAAVVWGVAGFLIGDILAWQLAFPVLNLDLPWTSFGRLRPLHTSAVIFAVPWVLVKLISVKGRPLTVT